MLSNAFRPLQKSGQKCGLDEAKTVHPNLDSEQRYLLVEASNSRAFAARGDFS
jgi:hypothetical protein